MTSRELVKRTLTFDHPERVPRQLWALPCATDSYPEIIKEINTRWPGDFARAPSIYNTSTRISGDPHRKGTYVDEWGCIFTNVHDGIIGEVREPLLKDIEEWSSILPPNETLDFDKQKARDTVNRAYEESDKFIMAACCPRPWERMQFIRGTEEAMVDVMMPDDGARDLIRVIHEFYMKELEFWVTTDVDAIMFMDDWGSQLNLIIPPSIWKDLFKPLYKDYCDIAKAHGKHTFMHSDGNITTIYPDLIEVGVDAINSQIFCMNIEELATIAKGKITFWGEIDRQHAMSNPDPQVARNAVQQVVKHLYDPAGGVIAQFEFGPGANPDAVLAIYDEWSMHT
jgi:hypothetical protein